MPARLPGKARWCCSGLSARCISRAVGNGTYCPCCWCRFCWLSWRPAAGVVSVWRRTNHGIYAVPALLLLVAAGVPLPWPGCARASQLGTLLLLLLLLVPAASAVQHVIVPWGRADCAGASAYVLAHRQPGDLMVGNSWEYLYYFGTAAMTTYSWKTPLFQRRSGLAHPHGKHSAGALGGQWDSAMPPPRAAWPSCTCMSAPTFFLIEPFDFSDPP